MKAVICTAYGSPDVLQIREIENAQPKDNEVRIKIHATSVSAGNSSLRSKNVKLWFLAQFVLGVQKPNNPILGIEFAGEIDSVGKDVTRFKKGDAVFGATGMSFGAYAEYKCLPEDAALLLKPQNMSYEEAAAVPIGAASALHFLKQGNIQRGQKVLIYGASGSVGTYAVQLAKYFGAEVTGVCSGKNIDLVKSLGADMVIDYTQEDFTQNGEHYDIIFDTVGKSSFSDSLNSLKAGGAYLLANPWLSEMLKGIWVSMTSSKKVVSGPASDTTEILIFLKELIEAGTLKAVVDRCYPLEQIAEAHGYVETGRKKGNVIIKVSD